MSSHAVDTPSSAALLAVVQTLLSVRGLDDVRAATAHGAGVISQYATLSLYEALPAGAIGISLRCGQELGPGAGAVDSLLSERAHRMGRAVSTLDMPPASDRERLVVRDYIRNGSLCIARPLQAYGEPTGVLVLHYANRVALSQAEFDLLRRFGEFAAVALSTARTRAELQNVAYSDALTGLANRRWLEMEFSRLQGSEVSVVVIDFDGLKTVNDTLGFDRGDELIRAVGATLAASATLDEFIVRYGGDEFVVVMPGASWDTAVRRAEELTVTLDGMPLPLDLASLFQGASVGPATAAAGEDLWDVLRRAATEMRSRKRRRKTDRKTSATDARAHIVPVHGEGTPHMPRYAPET